MIRLLVPEWSRAAAKFDGAAYVGGDTMSDVVTIAKECRAALAAEVAKIDEFVRMAESLAQYSNRLTFGRTVVAINSSPAAKTIEFIEDLKVAEAISISEKVTAPDAAIAPTVTIQKAASLGPNVPDIFLKIRSVHGNAPAPKMADAALDQEGSAVDEEDAAEFAEAPSPDELVLLNPNFGGSDAMDVHIGQRLRQRRWMMGMAQQQLGDIIGVKFDEIQKYETGASRIGVRTMWDIAAALEVPVAYFFEDIEGQAADSGEVLTDEEAIDLVGDTQQVRRA